MIGPCEAQSFTYLNISPIDNIGVDIIQLQDSSYILLNVQIANNFSHVSSSIIALDKFGNYLYTKQLADTTLLWLFTNQIVSDGLGNFYAVGSTTMDTSLYRYTNVWFAKFDTNFDTVWTKQYHTSDTAELCNNMVYLNGHFYLAGAYYYKLNNGGQTGPLPLLYDIDSQGNLIKTFYEDTFGLISSIGFDSYNNLLMGADIYYPYFQLYKYTLNSGLAVLDTCYISETGNNNYQINLGQNKNASVFDGINNSFTHTQTKIQIIDEQCQNTFKLDFGNPNEDSRCAYFGAIDTISKNRIIVGGTANFIYGTSLYMPVQSQFHCAVFDDSLNVIWESHAGDDAYHVMMRAKPTLDGGVVCVGYRYDYLNNFPTENRDPIVMKFDSLGNIQGSYDNNNQYQSMFNVYPNPASDILNIEALDNLEYDYEVYNITGDRLMQGELKSHTKINILKFSSGVYYLKIVSKKGSSFKKFLVTH